MRRSQDPSKQSAWCAADLDSSSAPKPPWSVIAEGPSLLASLISVAQSAQFDREASDARRQQVLVDELMAEGLQRREAAHESLTQSGSFEQLTSTVRPLPAGHKPAPLSGLSARTASGLPSTAGSSSSSMQSWGGSFDSNAIPRPASTSALASLPSQRSLGDMSTAGVVVGSDARARPRPAVTPPTSASLVTSPSAVPRRNPQQLLSLMTGTAAPTFGGAPVFFPNGQSSESSTAFKPLAQQSSALSDPSLNTLSATWGMQQPQPAIIPPVPSASSDAAHHHPASSDFRKRSSSAFVPRHSARNDPTVVVLPPDASETLNRRISLNLDQVAPQLHDITHHVGAANREPPQQFPRLSGNLRSASTESVSTLPSSATTGSNPSSSQTTVKAHTVKWTDEFVAELADHLSHAAPRQIAAPVQAAPVQSDAQHTSAFAGPRAVQSDLLAPVELPRVPPRLPPVRPSSGSPRRKLSLLVGVTHSSDDPNSVPRAASPFSSPWHSPRVSVDQAFGPFPVLLRPIVLHSDVPASSVHDGPSQTTADASSELHSVAAPAEAPAAAASEAPNVILVPPPVAPRYTILNPPPVPARKQILADFHRHASTTEESMMTSPARKSRTVGHGRDRSRPSLGSMFSDVAAHGPATSTRVLPHVAARAGIHAISSTVSFEADKVSNAPIKHPVDEPAVVEPPTVPLVTTRRSSAGDVSEHASGADSRAATDSLELSGLGGQPEPESKVQHGRVLYDYLASRRFDMAIEKGQILEILTEENDGWWLVRTEQGEEGYVPGSYVERLPATPVEDPSGPLEESNSAASGHTLTDDFTVTPADEQPASDVHDHHDHDDLDQHHFDHDHDSDHEHDHDHDHDSDHDHAPDLDAAEKAPVAVATPTKRRHMRTPSHLSRLSVLTRRNSTLSIASSSSTAPSNASHGSHKRFLAAREVFETEQSYIDGLECMVRVYREPLLADCKVLPKNELLAFFPGDIDALLRHHRCLLAILAKRIENWTDSVCFGDIFTGTTVDFFAQQYVPYCVQYPTAADKLHQTLKQNERFRAQVRERDKHRNGFVAQLHEARRSAWMERFEAMHDAAKREGVEPSTTAAILASLIESADAALDKQKGQSATLSIDALLLTPIQRMPRYCLLIQTVLKYTPSSHPDSFHLAHALDRLRRLTDYVNECKRDMENAARLAQMSHLIKRIPKDFYSPTRRLVRESDVMVYHGSGVGWEKGRLFMLNDALLFTTNRLHPGRRIDFAALKFADLLLFSEVRMERQSDPGHTQLGVLEREVPRDASAAAAAASAAAFLRASVVSSDSSTSSTRSVSSASPDAAARPTPPQSAGSGHAFAIDASLRTLIFSTSVSTVQVCFETMDEMESWLSDAQALQADFKFKLRFASTREQQLVDL
ncbi:hypothetical protein CAOG_02935 [Capsaspora owczarzaki ATCC 30864]|uniref:DH domain-containing protein n=1 Tax=Capsaspora owczarzaki (strain ATCC 30864) TaxID=595528 RepID=A0A0D2VNH2_CAPO3|nr:hypothetical protein CAOG_02935 [Capsaspora owczarzaki ATCC 30864]KJE91867.1 hypothetical protein CAOG_002935 [Capsaspora owczarzaki ATCC 30864]|eukprot:XP_004363774.1 hypothetical protein CAOG_02935 [Capsaspora owczarzaki ATCC 30864]